MCKNCRVAPLPLWQILATPPSQGPIPPSPLWLESFKKGGGRRRKEGIGLCHYTKHTPNNGNNKNAVLIHTFSKISLAPSHTLPRSVILLLHLPPPPPPLTNPGYTTVTGVAIRGYKGPHWLERLNLMCKKCLFDTQIFKNLPTVVLHHSPTRSLRSLALAPCWKILAKPVIILFMFVLYISRYPSVRNTQFPWKCIFFFFYSNFFPKKSTQGVHQIVQFQSQKCKSLPRVGGGLLPHPPPARALRTLACVFSRIL